MHTVHAGLSIAAPLKGNVVSIVNRVLKQLNNNNGSNFSLPFDKSRTTISASAIVIPQQFYGEERLPDTLTFFTTYWGPFNAHFDELIAVGASGLRELFKHCIGFPPAALTDNEALKIFLIDRKHGSMFYSGMHHITAKDIVREENLRKVIDAFLYERQLDTGFAGVQPKTIRKIIQHHIESKGDEFLWCQKLCKKTFMDYWLLRGPSILVMLILLLLSIGMIWYFGWASIIPLLLLIAFLLSLVFYLNKMANNQRVSDRPPDCALRIIARSQNNPVINQMTAAGPLKQGRIRPIIFRTILKLSGLVSGGVVVTTITAARWLAIDKGKRLVFISNYANRSDSYIRDFVDISKNSTKLDLLFGQCDGWPIIKWFAKNTGARGNLRGFMNAVSENQFDAKLWYCPHKNLSVDNIKKNHKIRVGLFADLNKEEINEWLRLL